MLAQQEIDQKTEPVIDQYIEVLRGERSQKIINGIIHEGVTPFVGVKKVNNLMLPGIGLCFQNSTIFNPIENVNPIQALRALWMAEKVQNFGAIPVVLLRRIYKAAANTSEGRKMFSNLQGSLSIGESAELDSVMERLLDKQYIDSIVKGWRGNGIKVSKEDVAYELEEGRFPEKREAKPEPSREVSTKDREVIPFPKQKPHPRKPAA